MAPGDRDPTPDDEPDEGREASDDDLELEASPAIGVIDPDLEDPPEPGEPA